MKVDLTKVLVDFDGDPIKQAQTRVVNNMVVELPIMKKVKQSDGTEKEEQQVWTLGKLCVNALSTPSDEDRTLAPDESIKRWKLAMDMHITSKDEEKGKEFEIEPEDATKIRARIAKMFPILLGGQACDMLKG